jgi:hypothetical protein
MIHVVRDVQDQTWNGLASTSVWTIQEPCLRKLARVRRDVDSGLASGQVLGTPTLFIDGVLHRDGYEPPALPAALHVLAS